ncbi:lipid carrier : UDP-N-acetylgalactosaminyltransferase /alpha-1,3-N-acetylgalactosamine transferase PglA [Vibrio astriarenae]|nr:lipid carrier : UDP-N-acetylgalactosaminyltransferase /alpha-1,3-N-acetylgalactosamine transferase PglA [Vibrio sp. C7]
MLLFLKKSETRRRLGPVMNKRVVITSNCSWFVANFFAPTIRELLIHNEVHVIASRDRHTEKLCQLGCHFHHLAVDRSGINPASEITTLVRLFGLVKRLEPDCVFNFTPKLNIYSTLVCRLLNIRVISTIAGLGSIISESGFRSMVGRILLRLTQPLTNHIVFQNEDDRHLYIERKYIASNKTSRVKGIGVELKRFPQTQPKDDDVVRFILFARMLRNKGVVDFIEAAKLIDTHFDELRKQGLTTPKYEFALLGFVDESNPQGLSLEQLREWDKQTCVQYLGATDNVLSVVQHYDCVVLPSFYREGIPQCLIEACAMSKPIITTDNVGCIDTTDHGNVGCIDTTDHV